MEMDGKVVIVTGGTRGIGYSIVKKFLENNAKVILFGSRSETVEKAVNSLKEEGYEASGYYPNLDNYDEVKDTMDKIYDLYGSIDILINNAGVSANKKIEDTTSIEFKGIMDLNINSMFNTSKAVIPYMKDKGSGVILNTSSMVSIYGQPSGVAYPASKSAVNGFTKSLAREVAPFNIRVNAVAPGVTETDMVKNLPKEMIEPIIKTIPLGRIGKPEDIANAFLFLASPLADYITGVVLRVDGLCMN